MNVLENLNVVFIVGCQRTGTTLTGNILAAHPNVFLIDEPDGVYEWAKLIFAGDTSENIEQKFREICLRARVKYKSPDSKCNSDGVLSSEITHIVLKAPNLTFAFQKLMDHFSHIFSIFTYRDIRDVVVSMSKLDWIPMVEKQIEWLESYPSVSCLFQNELEALKSDSLKAHQARAMIATIKTGIKDFYNSPALRKLEVKYEDLTQYPEIWNKNILVHLGLSYRAIDFSSELIGWGPGLTYRRNKINTFSIGKWKEYLTDIEENDIWEISKDIMSELGYKRIITDINTNAKWLDINLKHKSAPIIATGRGGSGTRLLSKMLQSLDVFLGNELGGMDDSIEWVSVLYKISIERTRQQFTQTKTQWKSSLQETAAEILQTADLDYSRKWGWKLPETMSALPEAFNAFPGAKLIHLTRHPVDSSLRRTHVTSRADNLMGRSVIDAAYKSLNWSDENKAKDSDYIKNAATWLYQVGEVVSFAREFLNSENYLEIKYEDLCLSPEETLRKIAAFLNIKIDGIKHNLEIDKNRMRSWKYPDSRADEVWDLCKDLAMKLGFEKITD